jgi:putative salt-induced outer membrane protein YdiY
MTLVLVFLLSGAVSVFADEVNLKNGDKITGEVKTWKEGKLTFKTGHGELTIPMKEIGRLVMKKNKPIQIGKAKAKAGTIVTDEKGRFSWEGKKHTLADITSIVTPPEKKKLTELQRWSGELGFALTWTDGNTHNLLYHGDLKLKRDQSQEVEEFRNKLSINLSYDYGKSGGDQIKRKGMGATKWDLFLHKCLSAYVEGSWLYDYEGGIERKNTLGAGLSCKAVDEKELKVTFDLGLSYVVIFYNGKALRAATAAGKTPVPFEEYPAMRAMAEVAWNLPWDFDFAHKTVLLKSLKEVEKYFLETETSISRKITSSWFFKLSAKFTFVEPPAPGKVRWDSTYILSLAFKF